MSRRGILVGTGGLLIGASLPSFALGLTEQSAVTFIRKVVVDVNIVINSNKSETEILADFEGIFADYSANSLIAKTALGAAGRKVSQNQLAAYIEAFQRYFSRKYGRQFRDFADSEINIVGNRDLGSKGVLVKSIVEFSNKPSYDLDWWVIEVNGQPKLFDLVIEGISMISSERTEIGALLESLGGDIDRLTAKLEAT
jgi:phospholipid transport system substrate-binding protein